MKLLPILITLAKSEDVFKLLRFGTPWCGPCYQLDDIWRELESVTENIKLESINCMNQADYCSNLGIMTFPKIILQKNGEHFADFPDLLDRSVFELKKFLLDATGPAPDDVVIPISENTFDMFVEEARLSVVSFHVDWCDPCSKMTEDLVHLARQRNWGDDIQFATFDCSFYPSKCDELGVNAYPSLQFHRSGKALPDSEILGALNHTELVEVIDIMIEQKPLQKRDLSITRGDATEAQESLAIAHTSTNGASKSTECLDSFSFYDGTREPRQTGCWAHDDSRNACVIANPDCLQLQCLADRMEGFIRLDAFNDPNLVAADVTELLNFSDENCEPDIQYDAELSGISFSIRLGQCGMTAESSQLEQGLLIKFSQVFHFTKQTVAGARIFFANDFASEFGFNCFYTSSTVTDRSQYSVTTNIINSNIEKFVNWDQTFGIQFYESERYETEIDAANLLIGDRVNARVEWREEFDENFPVEFFINQCTISNHENDKEYMVIKDGCLSELARTELHSDEAYSTDTIDFSYESFTFEKQEFSFELFLQCSISLCLKADRIFGSCGIPTNCPEGYTSVL